MNDYADEKIANTVDATGLTCPEPVMLLHSAVRDAGSGELIEVLATDPSTTRDIPRFCEFLSHELVLQETVGDKWRFLVRKG